MQHQAHVDISDERNRCQFYLSLISADSNGNKSGFGRPPASDIIDGGPFCSIAAWVKFKIDII